MEKQEPLLMSGMELPSHLVGLFTSARPAEILGPRSLSMDSPFEPILGTVLYTDQLPPYSATAVTRRLSRYCRERLRSFRSWIIQSGMTRFFCLERSKMMEYGKDQARKESEEAYYRSLNTPSNRAAQMEGLRNMQAPSILASSLSLADICIKLSTISDRAKGIAHSAAALSEHLGGDSVTSEPTPLPSEVHTRASLLSELSRELSSLEESLRTIADNLNRAHAFLGRDKQ